MPSGPMAGEELTQSPVSNSQRTVSGFPTFVFGSVFPIFVFGSVFFSQPVRHKHKANKAREMGFIEYLVVSKEICGRFIVATRRPGQQAHRVSDDLSKPHGKHHPGVKACASLCEFS